MILYCIRHGETTFNADGRIQGQLDSPLSERGRRQCLALAQRLSDSGIAAIWCSPLRRAVDSALPLAELRGLPLQKDERLMELNAGVFQGKNWAEIDRELPEEARRWRSHDPDFCIPGGESRRDLMLRALAVMQDIRATNLPAVAVVSHGGLLNAALKALLDIPAQRNPFALHNGSISRLHWRSEVQLITVNEVDHLQGELAGSGDL